MLEDWQELSTHMVGYSIQTANCFDVVSVVGGGEHVLSCREVQDLQAELPRPLRGRVVKLPSGVTRWSGCWGEMRNDAEE